MTVIITPLIPDEVVDFAREHVRLAYDAGLELTAAEMLARGQVDFEGEPSIGVFPTWRYDEDDALEDGSAPIIDLEIRLAEREDSDAAPAWIFPFREEEDVEDRLTGFLVAQVHFEMARRMNPERPLRELADDDLETMIEEQPQPALLKTYPNEDAVLEANAYAEFAKLERVARENKEETGQ